MKRFIARTLLFLAVFGLAVLLLNTTMLPPESEAKPLVIAGTASALDAEGMPVAAPAGATATAGRID